MIQNNVVDINRLSNKEATALEKNIYRRFTSSKQDTNRHIRSELSYSNTRYGNQLSESLQDYLDYIYALLSEREILSLTAEDKSDENYVKYINQKISLSKFLQYAISKNWINLEYLEIGNDYYSTEEIYEKLINYIFDILHDDIDYDKQIYKNMIYDYNLSGREICLLLYSQKVIQKNNTEMERLQSGAISAYEFVKAKIRSLDITPGQLGLEPCSGSIVVTDVNTGKVKAMVSYPSYDNNKFAGSVDSEYFSKINSNKAAPLLNRSTQQKTAPGSTYKMLVASASLEEGIINPYTTVKDKTTFTNIHPSPKCWSTNSSHGTINVTQAIRDSCNYFFYEMGFRLGDGAGENVNNEKGLKKLEKYAKIYGLTETSGVELTESEPTVSDMDTVRSAIGQGTNSYTPVQLSRYVTSIANNGICYDLTIIDKIKNSQEDKAKENKAKVHNKLSFAESTLSAITQGMRLVVKDGSIRSMFHNLPIDVAGKTGTAQESAFKPNHALFVSYAPYEDPEISVTTVIANGYTSSNAAELASDVYLYYFDKGSRKRLLNQRVSTPKVNSGAVTD
jgi:penicillin-binding protein 2